MKKIGILVAGTGCAALLFFAIKLIMSVESMSLVSSTSAEKNPSKNIAPILTGIVIDPSQTGIQENQGNQKNPITLYKSIGGAAGRMALDEIYMQGLPATPESVVAVRKIFAQGVSDDEKVALTRILGGLHQTDNPTGHNEIILADLRALTNDLSKEVARTAVITYARLGYFSGSEIILDVAYKKNVLTPDEYFGELAHLVQAAPVDVKPQIIEKMRHSPNAYASDILALAVNSDQKSLADYSVEALTGISQILDVTQPEFPSATGEFGLLTALRYGNWLRANAQIASARSGKNIDSLIVENLSQKNIDPRKIMAYLLTPESSSLLESAALGSPVNGLVVVANQYAAQYPGNLMVQEYAQDITRRASAKKQ